MAYQRITKDEYQIHVNYGFGDGYEHEISEDTRKEGLKRLKEYRENCPEYRVKMVAKRIAR